MNTNAKGIQSRPSSHQLQITVSPETYRSNSGLGHSPGTFAPNLNGVGDDNPAPNQVSNNKMFHPVINNKYSILLTGHNLEAVAEKSVEQSEIVQDAQKLHNQIDLPQQQHHHQHKKSPVLLQASHRNSLERNNEEIRDITSSLSNKKFQPDLVRHALLRGSHRENDPMRASSLSMHKKGVQSGPGMTSSYLLPPGTKRQDESTIRKSLSGLQPDLSTIARERGNTGVLTNRESSGQVELDKNINTLNDVAGRVGVLEQELHRKSQENEKLRRENAELVKKYSELERMLQVQNEEVEFEIMQLQTNFEAKLQEREGKIAFLRKENQELREELETSRGRHVYQLTTTGSIMERSGKKSRSVLRTRPVSSSHWGNTAGNATHGNMNDYYSTLGSKAEGMITMPQFDMDKTEKFIAALRDTMMNILGAKDKENQPSLKQIWKWLRKILFEYINLKKTQDGGAAAREGNNPIDVDNLTDQVNQLTMENNMMGKIISKLKTALKLDRILTLSELDRAVDKWAANHIPHGQGSLYTPALHQKWS